MPVHELSGYRAIIVRQLVSNFVPDGACAMSARMPLKSEVSLDQKQSLDPKIIARCPWTVHARWFFELIDPKNYRPDAVIRRRLLDEKKLLLPSECHCRRTDAGRYCDFFLKEVPLVIKARKVAKYPEFSQKITIVTTRQQYWRPFCAMKQNIKKACRAYFGSDHSYEVWSKLGQ